MKWHLMPAALVVCGMLYGQGSPAPIKAGPLTITGSWRTRIESWDWFQGDANNDYTYPGTLLRLGIGQRKDRYDWEIEFAAPILLGLPNDAIAPGAQGQLGLGASYYVANDRSRNAAMVFVKQGYVRLKRLGGSEAQSLRLGRFEFVDGSEVVPKDPTLAAVKRTRIANRLIGDFGWSHVGRSMDGIQYVYNKPTWNLTLVGARPTRGVFQVDGWGELDVAFGYAALTRPVKFKNSDGEARLFVIQYEDWRSVLKVDNRPLAARQADHDNVRITTVGGHYIHAFHTSAGTFDALFWGALQTGRWGLLDQRSGAAAMEAGYQPPIRTWKPWIRGGYFYGSADGNPNDGTHGTFFQLLPTPRIYARFPFYNLMNNEDRFGELILRPSKSLTIRSDVHALRLANANDLWYLGGGAFQPWTFGFVGRSSQGRRGLATMFDVSADYKVTPEFSIGAYFAAAQGKGVPAAIYPAGKNAHLGFLEFGYQF